MANEVRFLHNQAGRTLKANFYTRALLRWDGTAYSAVDADSNKAAAWTNGLVNVAELQTSDTTPLGCGWYRCSIPGGSPNGLYYVTINDSTDASGPGSFVVAQLAGLWDGANWLDIDDLPLLATADQVLDKSGTPWVLKSYIRGTLTLLFSQRLFDVATGAAVSSVTPIGQIKQ